jgi:23S rRNA (adenine2503-C2)-methyltransferase
VVETVIIRAPNRLTLCLSSQVGCAIGCKFCHTGTMGLTRNLFTAEVIGQFLQVEEWLRENPLSEAPGLTNIVYMGQGEPLHNYENMKTATTIFLEPNGLGMGQRRITLSTSGLVPQIEKLGEFPPVNIALSLHSARNEFRDEIMPINKAYDLKRLFEAIKKIPLKAHRRITYEYILLDGLNNTEQDIEAIANLLPVAESKINLIPFNDHPGSPYKKPSFEKNQWFMDRLIKKGFVCTIRTTKGDDILAACGQLKTKDKEVRSQRQN